MPQWPQWPRQPKFIKIFADPDGWIIPSTQMTNTSPFLWNGSSKIHFSMIYVTLSAKSCWVQWVVMSLSQAGLSHSSSWRIFSLTRLGSWPFPLSSTKKNFQLENPKIAIFWHSDIFPYFPCNYRGLSTFFTLISGVLKNDWFSGSEIGKRKKKKMI